MVSDHLLAAETENVRRFHRAVPAPSAPTAYPAAWERRALAAVRDRGAFASLSSPLQALRAFPRWFPEERMTQLFENDNAVARIALSVERELRPRVLMVLLIGIDPLSHLLWGLLEPERLPERSRPTPEERDAGVAR